MEIEIATTIVQTDPPVAEGLSLHGERPADESLLSRRSGASFCGVRAEFYPSCYFNVPTGSYIAARTGMVMLSVQPAETGPAPTVAPPL
jgi:hypothetical protein